MPYKDPERRREWSRNHAKEKYQKDGGIIRRRSVEWNRERRQEMRRWIFVYLKSHPCVDCGEADPIVLDFDHRDKDSKVSGVSEMVRQISSWSSIQAEIEKCDIRCANCHRRRTAVQMGWYSYANDAGLEDQTRVS